MRSLIKLAAIGSLAVTVFLAGCTHSPLPSPATAKGAPGQQAQKGHGGGTPCWAGTWRVRSKTVTASEPDGSTIRVTGDAGEVLTFQTNGILFVDYSHAGALVGTSESGPIAVQYQGIEDAQITMTGSTSGTFTEKIVDGALFTTVSDGQSNTQKDQPGATETDQYTCSGASLVLQGQGVQESLFRNG